MFKNIFNKDRTAVVIKTEEQKEQNEQEKQIRIEKQQQLNEQLNELVTAKENLEIAKGEIYKTSDGFLLDSNIANEKQSIESTKNEISKLEKNQSNLEIEIQASNEKEENDIDRDIEINEKKLKAKGIISKYNMGEEHDMSMIKEVDKEEREALQEELRKLYHYKTIKAAQKKITEANDVVQHLNNLYETKIKTAKERQTEYENEYQKLSTEREPITTKELEIKNIEKVIEEIKRQIEINKTKTGGGKKTKTKRKKTHRKFNKYRSKSNRGNNKLSRRKRKQTRISF